MTTFNTFKQAQEFALNTRQEVFKIRGVMCVMTEKEARGMATFCDLQFPDYIDLLADEKKRF